MSEHRPGNGGVPTPAPVPVRRRWRLALPALGVFVGMAAVAVGAAWVVQRAVDRQQDQAQAERSGEVAAALLTGVHEVQSALGVLANVPVGAPSSPAIFQQASAPLLTGSVRFVGVAQHAGDQFPLLAAVGADPTSTTALVVDRAALAARAASATGFVSAVLHDGGETRLGYALASPDGTRVVLRETAIDPTTPAATVRGQAWSDLHIAVYAAPSTDTGALVLTTSAALPLVGDTYRQSLPVGADHWQLVTSARAPLVGSFSERAPWVTLLAGLVLAALLAVLVATLSRRRAYALALVDARTADLEATMREHARLEEEARQASVKAMEASRSKSEFLSRMSHELRTPLNAVLGFAQLLELEDLTETERESVNQIKRGGEHLLGLINEVLDISRIETGTLALSSEPVLAKDVLADALDLMRPVAQEHHVTLIGDALAMCEVHVFADRQRLKQILLNLLSNGIKYNLVGGRVAVSCQTTDGRLRINIADTGAGIAPEYLHLLFEPFERLGAATTGIEGTGIGLALSRRLAEAMGGTLDVETTVGRGSTFWVELPVVESPIERHDRLDTHFDVPAVAGDGHRHAIVYIEDNLSNLRLVERLLERRGDIELVAAMQGRLGLELVRQHEPVAVLLDLHLPDIDGEEVLRQLRLDPATAGIPVVMLSAEATPGHAQRLVAAGASTYLTKPLDVRLFMAVIDQLVADARPAPLDATIG
jgi:signal transduction histidine kinase/CheY-like chemotaxis protein